MQPRTWISSYHDKDFANRVPIPSVFFKKRKTCFSARAQCKPVAMSNLLRDTLLGDLYQNSAIVPAEDLGESSIFSPPVASAFVLGFTALYS